jgi:hypothetical protein
VEPIFNSKAEAGPRTVTANRRNVEKGAIKHDDGKNDLSLLSPIWILGVGRVLTFGKRKYDAHNWRKGMALSRLLAAALRHIFAFIGGEDRDPETGECHLDHASCCLMFAREMWERRQDCDDRYRPDQISSKT